jgi:Mg-chelatase subunit ChlD
MSCNGSSFAKVRTLVDERSEINGADFKKVFLERFGTALTLGDSDGSLKDYLTRAEAKGACSLEMRPMPKGPPCLFVLSCGGATACGGGGGGALVVHGGIRNDLAAAMSQLSLRGDGTHTIKKVSKIQKEEAVKSPPNDVHCYLDTSGSMAGGFLEACKTAMLDLYSTLEREDGISLHQFDNSMRILQPIDMLSKIDRAGFERKVHALSANGGTALHDALVHGMAEAKKAHDWASTRGKRTQRLIVLTDGEDNASRATLAMAREAIRKPGIPTCKVYFVAVGAAIGSSTVTELATLGVVEVIEASDAKGITDAFHRIKTRIVTVTTCETTVVTIQSSKTVSRDVRPGSGHKPHRP